MGKRKNGREHAGTSTSLDGDWQGAFAVIGQASPCALLLFRKEHTSSNFNAAFPCIQPGTHARCESTFVMEVADWCRRLFQRVLDMCVHTAIQSGKHCSARAVHSHVRSHGQ